MNNITNTLQNLIQETNPTSQIDNLVNRLTDFVEGTRQKENTFILSAAAGGSILLLYLATVRHLRYKNIKFIREKYPNPQDILDNIDIAREITSITAKKEFPCKV